MTCIEESIWACVKARAVTNSCGGGAGKNIRAAGNLYVGIILPSIDNYYRRIVRFSLMSTMPSGLLQRNAAVCAAAYLILG
jgi:hypothetical protein